MSQPVRRAVRSLWISLGVALVMLTVVEGTARAGIVWHERRLMARQQATVEAIYRDGVSGDPGWIAGYLRELGGSNETEWHSYVYWRRKPYQGTYINVEKTGLRRTWNATATPDPGHLKIFMFGGSTMWGEGARDEFTIPSLVSKKLAASLPTGVWVTNLGEHGYVSTQEVIALMLEVQRGHVPDIAVFYDGANDMGSVIQSQAAGTPLNESHRVAEFNLRRRLNWRQGFVEHLALYRLSQWVVRSLSSTRAEGYPSESPSPTGPLANSVVDAYLRNISMVDSLARQVGFQTVFFWQPTVFTTSKRLSPHERWRRSRHQLGWGASFYLEVHQVLRERVRSGTVAGVHDLSGVLDNQSGTTVFLDPLHVTEAGNELIAEAMVRILRGMARKANP